MRCGFSLTLMLGLFGGPAWAQDTPAALKSVCPVPGEGPALSPLRVEARQVYAERSRDSHSSRTQGSFDGRILTVSGAYGPCVRGRCAHGEVRLELLEDEIAALTNLVDTLDLWSSLTDRDESEWKSPHRSTTVSLTLSDGARSAQSEIFYRRGWVDGERVQSGSAEAHARSTGVNELLTFMRATSLRCYPDFKRS